MEVKPGYKQTEVGVIPQEWEVKTLRDSHFDISDGNYSSKYPKASDFRRFGVPFIRANNIRDMAVVDDDMRFISVKQHQELKKGHLKAGDILITTRGEIGQVALVPQCHIDSNINAQLVRINTGNSGVDHRFLAYSITSRKAQEQLKELETGSALKQLPVGRLILLRLAFPSLPEQRAIAEALIDVDRLLDRLDQLITKKRDLKQAAMQQLLTDQTRLPAFHGKWEVKTLGDLGSTYGGLIGKTKNDFGEGLAQYVTFMNVMTNVVIDTSIFGRVKVSPAEPQNRVVMGDLLFNGSSETPEEVAMCSVLTADVPNLFLNSFCFGFRFRDGAKVDGLFMAYYLRSKEGRELIKSLAQGSTRYNLSKAALLNAPLRLPPLPEQTAIAAVLSDMDAEIAALERRREKTRALKQAMMQELLTGKTRLVES